MRIISSKGFTLLEIMIAIAILAMATVVILDLQATSLVRSGRAEEVTVATMLARLKIREVQLSLEKKMAQGEFPSENSTEGGTFDEPFERYKWEVAINKVDIPVPPMPEKKEGEEGSETTAAEAAGTDVMLQAFQIVAEKIKEAAREIKIKIIWDELGEEQTLEAATHIVNL